MDGDTFLRNQKKLKLETKNQHFSQNIIKYITIEQAGAELCQAQGKLRLARLLSYPCLICLINLISLVLVGYRMGVHMFILVSLEW